MTTCEDHTVCPSSYVEWAVWAEKKSKTHEQVRCDECGRWAIWKKKPRGLVPETKVQRIMRQFDCTEGGAVDLLNTVKDASALLGADEDSVLDALLHIRNAMSRPLEPPPSAAP